MIEYIAGELMIEKYYDVERINKLLGANPQKVIVDTESNYRGQLFRLADDIEERGNVQVVLLAGPSCAGKTTSAKLLKEVLEKKGKHVITVSMDDFFINRADTPFLPNGQRDYENPHTVNAKQIEECFTKLWTGQPTGFPVFDFKEGINMPNQKTLTKQDNTIVIFEGLHALNPYIYEHLGTTNYYRVYIGSMSGFRYQDDIIDVVDLRLIRRIIRDIDTRGYSVADTLKSWDTVCDGENKYINPYREEVDYFIDTTHMYELSVYKACILELRARNMVSDADFEGMPLISVVMHGTSLGKDLIPDTSLMWEFVQKPNQQ